MISCGEPDENNLLANRWIGRVPRKGFHAVRGRNVFQRFPVSFLWEVGIREILMGP